MEHVVQVASGGNTSYALLEDGHVLAWGSNDFGQLGTGAEGGKKVIDVPPAEVVRRSDNANVPLEDVVAISAGNNHALALLANGEVLGWGDNRYGEVGAESGEECGGTPCDKVAMPIMGLEGAKFTAIAAGLEFSLALGEGGTVYSVGRNNMAELGNGGTCENKEGALGEQRSCYYRDAQPIPGLEHVSAISAGGAHAMALLEEGVQPPAPMITLTPGPATLKLTWTATDAHRVNYRIFGEPPAEEPDRCGQECQEEKEAEGTETGAPVNEVVPLVEELEADGSEVKEGEVLEGGIVVAHPGAWSGLPPLSYEFIWQRCRSEKCETISEPIRGETAKLEDIPQEDVGYTLRVEVTARNSVDEQGVTAISEPTRIVKSEDEEGRSHLNTRPVTAEEKKEFENREFTIREMCFGKSKAELCGKPLEKIEYQVKLEDKLKSGESGEVRTVYGTPLEE